MKPVEIIKSVKRLVVKVGTSVLTKDCGYLSRVTSHNVQSIASEVATLWGRDKEVILVTSGAIGAGMTVLDLKHRPTDLPQLQAAAATGQSLLMQWYASRFEEGKRHVAQILLTRGDLEDPRRRMNAKATIDTLLKKGIVPIINENDTVAVEEIRYGDNDILSAHVASLIDADLLILLSDVDKLIGLPEDFRMIDEITPALERLAKGTKKAVSTGGMRTKLEAAKIVMAKGIPMVLMNGRARNHLVDLFFKGDNRGTWFLPKRGHR